MKKIFLYLPFITICIFLTGCFKKDKSNDFAMHLISSFKFKCQKNNQLCELSYSDKISSDEYQNIILDNIIFNIKNNELITEKIDKVVFTDEFGNNILYRYKGKKIIYNYKNETTSLIEKENGNAYRYSLEDDIIVTSFNKEDETEYMCSYVTDRLLKNKCQMYKEDLKEVKNKLFKKYLGNYSIKDIIKK